MIAIATVLFSFFEHMNESFTILFEKLQDQQTASGHYIVYSFLPVGASAHF